MTLDFKEERDNDLRKAEKSVIERLGEAAIYVQRQGIVKMVCLEPAPRYYASRNEAMRVFSRMRKGCCIHKKGYKNMMFQALYKEYRKLEKENPGVGCAELVEMAINTPAPSFFLDESYIYQLLNQKTR